MDIEIDVDRLQITMLENICNKRKSKRDIVDDYALLICTTKRLSAKIINRAIIDRWSVSGLNDIKRDAWSVLQKTSV